MNLWVLQLRQERKDGKTIIKNENFLAKAIFVAIIN